MEKESIDEDDGIDAVKVRLEEPRSTPIVDGVSANLIQDSALLKIAG